MATPTTTLPRSTNADHLVDQAADKVDQSVNSAKRVATDTLDQLQEGIARVRDSIPNTMSRTASQVEDLARRSVERARELKGDVSDRVERATDQTIGYIKDEPVKSVLIAAAAGAVLALVVGSLARSNQSRR